MALAIGSASITVANDGSVTYGGSGLAYAFAQTRFNVIVTAMQNAYGNPYPAALLSAIVAGLRANATTTVNIATADATSVINHLKSNGEVPLAGLQATITTQSAGTLPNPPNAGSALVAPGAGAPVNLPCNLGVGGTSLSIT